MRTHTTIVLFVINIIVFGAIYYLQNVQDARISERISGSDVFGLELADIQTITVQGKQLKDLRTLERTDAGHWLLQSPIHWKANPYAVQRILMQLQLLKREVSFSVKEIEASGQTLADYGLEHPSLEIGIAGKGKLNTLLVGQPTKIGSRIYCLSPDREDIIVVSQGLIESLSIPLEDMRSRSVFDMQPFEVRGVTIKTESPSSAVVLAKEGDNWAFETPLQADAHNGLVDGMVVSLLSLEPQSFMPASEIEALDTGLSKPQLRLTLVATGNNRQVLKIGNALEQEDDTYYAEFEGLRSVFIVSIPRLKDLQLAQDYLRDKRIFKFDFDALTQLEIATDNRSILLQRLESGDWKLIETVKESDFVMQSVDPKIVDDLITELKRLEAAEFVTDAPSENDRVRFGIHKPQRRVKLTIGKEERTLLIGSLNRESKAFYAQVEGVPFIYEVSPYFLAALQMNTLHYRTRMLEVMPEKAMVQSLKLINLDTGDVYFDVTRPVDTSWDLAASGLSDGKQTAFHELADSILRFEVHSYLVDTFEPVYKLDDDHAITWNLLLEAEVFFPGGNDQNIETRHYYFTKRLGGNFQVGGNPESDKTFRLTQATMDILFALTFDPSLMSSEYQEAQATGDDENTP